MKKGFVIASFMLLLVAAITLRSEEEYLNIIGIVLAIISMILIAIYLRKNRKQK